MSVQVKRVTISSAEMLALNGTPKLMLAAPPSGYMNVILGITHFLDFNSIAYATAASMGYGWTVATNDYAFYDDWIFLQTADTEMPIYRAEDKFSVFATIHDLYLKANVNPTAGNSPMYSYIMYQELLIS